MNVRGVIITIVIVTVLIALNLIIYLNVSLIRQVFCFVFLAFIL